MSLAFTPNFFLTRCEDELVLHLGQPVQMPTGQKTRVLIVGGGVTGLTTAWALLDAGCDVTIISDQWASAKDRVGSQISGAIWEWPLRSSERGKKSTEVTYSSLPLYHDAHTLIGTLPKSKIWAMTSYRIFDKLQTIVPPSDSFDHGVRMLMANFFFAEDIEQMADKGQLEKWEDIVASEIKGARRDATLINLYGVNQQSGVADSYQYFAPVIDTVAYLDWLRFIITCKGATFDTRRVNGPPDMLVNASGLGARELAEDNTLYPLRGALIQVINDGRAFPKVTDALVVSPSDTGGIGEDMVFHRQAHEGPLQLLVPGLDNAKYDPWYAISTGIGPFRSMNARVEREQRRRSDGSASRIIHSYGHGGSGFTLSFGCANDVLGLIHDLEDAISAFDKKSLVAHL
ncbi:nucleotide-binding domain-containing protein [Hymenopellis radicata]|nr:nucleotide-binding domain-containing protein [Hymenopellis radicata]